MKKLILSALIFLGLFFAMPELAQAQYPPSFLGVVDYSPNLPFRLDQVYNAQYDVDAYEHAGIFAFPYNIGGWTWDYVTFFAYGPDIRWSIKSTLTGETCHDEVQGNGYIQVYWANNQQNSYWWGTSPEVASNIAFYWSHGVDYVYEGELFAVNDGSQQFNYAAINEDCLWYNIGWQAYIL